MNFRYRKLEYQTDDTSQVDYTTSIIVFDPEPYFTGLYNAEGEEIWAGYMDEIGFIRHSEETI